MSEKAKVEDKVKDKAEQNRELSDEEAGKASGGWGQTDYDRWERYGPVDRSRFGPGAGE